MEVNNLNITPEFYHFNSIDEVVGFRHKHKDSAQILILDLILSQLAELIKSRNPQKPLTKDKLEEQVKIYLNGKDAASYGVWVYYPWSHHLVHLLDEEEFIEVRTNRNQYKITPHEQKILSKKKVGIIGLSVGQSVALTMAMERSFGELRLADFDTLDLSNLNRLRGSVMQLGLPKTVICAREILELDPFLKVLTFDEGIHDSNIDAFMKGEGKLDLLIEECDGLDIKILARHKAKEFGIPVLMETSDRGLLDIERFDLERDRPLLHGLIGDLNPARLKGLSMEDRIEYLLPMVGLNALSERMKASMIEVQSSIISWPQLGSAVTMGGGVAAEMSRKILLDQSTVSGRFYIDLDELVPEPQLEQDLLDSYSSFMPLSEQEIIEMVQSLEMNPKQDVLNADQKESIVNAAITAPSGGNTQPWRLTFSSGYLLLFHDKYHSHSFLDFANLGSYIGFGAMVENIRTQALALGYQTHYLYFPEPMEYRMVAACWFEPQSEAITESHQIRAQAIYSRLTNRGIGERVALQTEFRESLSRISDKEKMAKLTLIEDAELMNQLADILSTAEMLLLLHPQGHYDMFSKELRMSEEEVLKTRDGIDVETLNMSKAEILAMRIASSRKAIEWVERIGGGEAFKKTTKKAIAHSSALGIISMPFYSPEAYLRAGEFLQKIWIETHLAGYSFQPVTQYTFLMARVNHGDSQGFNESYKKKFNDLSNRFKILLPNLNTRELVFIFRLAKEKDPKTRSLRRHADQIIIRNKS